MSDIRTKFISSFSDKYGEKIKEGDVLRMVFFQKREKYHYEERFDSMGNGKPTKIKDGETIIKGTCLYLVQWSGDCLVAERTNTASNFITTASYYLNRAFISEHNPLDIEVLGNIHDGYKIEK